MWYRTPTFSGGVPLFIMCLCLQSNKDASCLLISMSIPCRYKLSCVKICFPMPARNYKAQFGLAIEIDIYIE